VGFWGGLGCVTYVFLVTLRFAVVLWVCLGGAFDICLVIVYFVFCLCAFAGCWCFWWFWFVFLVVCLCIFTSCLVDLVFCDCDLSVVILACVTVVC